jgi:protein-tyrosine-phosphatase
LRRILFVCVGNAGRSQMAEAFARHHAGKMELEIDARSGGTVPAPAVDSQVVALMLEKGLDISAARPKRLDLEFARAADAIVSLCGPLDAACPAPLLPKVADWGLEDPKGAPAEKVRAIRDEIERRVMDLLSAMQWSEAPETPAEPAAPDTTRLPAEASPHAPPRAGIKRGEVLRRREDKG